MEEQRESKRASLVHPWDPRHYAPHACFRGYQGYSGSFRKLALLRYRKCEGHSRVEWHWGHACTSPSSIDACSRSTCTHDRLCKHEASRVPSRFWRFSKAPTDKRSHWPSSIGFTRVPFRLYHEIPGYMEKDYYVWTELNDGEREKKREKESL